MSWEPTYLNGPRTRRGHLYEASIWSSPRYEDGMDNVCACKLIRTLYGLKQSGRVWNEELTTVFLKLGYTVTRLLSNQCVYIRHDESSSSQSMWMTTWSDDDAVNNAKLELSQHWKTTDGGPAKKMLVIEVERDLDAGLLKITQKQYVTRVLERFGMSDSFFFAEHTLLSRGFRGWGPLFWTWMNLLRSGTLLIKK